MGQIVQSKLPCKDQVDCCSSDAMAVYDDNSYFCFSCGKRFPPDGEIQELVSIPEKPNNLFNLEEIATYPVRGIKERGVTKTVCDFFDVRVSVDSSGNIDTHYYPYGVTEVDSYKVRTLPKTFISTGKLHGLFGQRKFSGASNKQLIITEGEIDALVVAQSWHTKHSIIYPVVSIAGSKLTKELLVQREWIRSFDKVVIWFDNDQPGKDAANEAARIIGYDKVWIAQNNHKDASDTFNKDGYEAVIKTIWNAKHFSPSGIVSSASTWETYKADNSVGYIPWAPFMEDLNKQNYGRKLGSITMITSGTGMGKTSWIKEDQYHLLKTRPEDERIGVCSLEESITEAVKNIMALEANKRIQLPDVGMTEEEELGYWQATMGSDRFMFLDHQGSLEDSSLIDKMEFMALSGCKYLYLDHITIAVSESEGGDVNAATDKLMSDLLKLAKRHNVWICVVSHLRKSPNGAKSFEEGAVPSEDDLKGSGALKQVPMQTFAVSRNKMEKDPVKRHTSYFWVLKDRFTGRTGPAGAYIFDETTGRLIRINLEEEFEAIAEGF